MIVVIVPRLGYSIEHISQWAEFHGLQWITFGDMTCDHELSVVITSDLYPTSELMRVLIDGVTNASQDITKRPFEGGEWERSFCLITKERLSDELLNDPKIFKYFHGMACRLEVAPKVDELMWKASTELSETERCDVLHQMVAKYWYSCSQQLIGKYYVHLWTNARQLECMRKGDYHNQSTYDALRKHAVFGNAIRHTIQTEKATAEEAIEFLSKGIFIEDAANETLKGISIDIPGHNPRGHVLSVNGMVTLNRKPALSLTPSETTVVSMYYDLGYSDKPNDAYLNSIRLFSRIPHPLVFYSTQDVCEEVKEIRDELGLLTKCISRDLEEWELVETYPDIFADTSTEKGMKASGKYAILTCTKFWALREVATTNPFDTSMIAWLDCGMFRHKHIAPKSLAGERLFEHAYKNTVVGKVTVPSMTLFSGTTADEFKHGDEYVVAITMFGDVDAWKVLCTKFIDFVIVQMAEGNVWTEQVMLSRIAGIFSTLLHSVFYGYNTSQFMRVLGYE